jgi:hypothetical protein
MGPERALLAKITRSRLVAVMDKLVGMGPVRLLESKDRDCKWISDVRLSGIDPNMLLLYERSNLVKLTSFPREGGMV